MLLQFSATNYQSIRARQTLSLVASSLKDEGVDLIEGSKAGHRVLPTAVIYGANASGKTSVLTGLELMADHVKYSHTRNGPGERIPRRPFALDENSKNEPTRFDCDFVINGVRYHYGFSYTSTEFVEEWLYAIGTGGRQRWFERIGADVKFGKYLKGQNRVTASLMRANSLFLSVAAQNAHPQLTEVFGFFQNVLRFELEGEVEPAAISARYKGGIDPRVVRFLRAADAGIVDAELETTPTDDKARSLISEVMEVVRKFSDSKVEVNAPDFTDVVRVRLAHVSVGGNPTFLNLQRESRGTLRLLALLSPVLHALDSGLTLVVDELDSSLHTLLAIELVRLFSSHGTNPKGAQLIASTHDTNLLRGGVLRRDQVWFTEKNDAGETCVYPLSEIATRKTDNLEKGYLQGRFGAVPFLGGVDEVFAAKTCVNEAEA